MTHIPASLPTRWFQAVTATLAVLSVVGESAAATLCTPPDHSNRPVIGVALGGGGARGGAHVGVLRALEEMRIPIDIIAGTSMGSIVGGLSATGMTSGEIEETIESLDWAWLFNDNVDRQDRSFRRKTDDDLVVYFPKIGVGEESSIISGGAVSGQKISFLFQELTSQRTLAKNFSDLPIPFRAIATDIVAGDPVVLQEGDLTLAMRASMSVPGVFDPVTIGDLVLVDGGLTNNVPINVVRDMGADIVIAVDVGAPLLKREELRNALNIIEQLTTLAVVQNTRMQLASMSEQDVLIQPDLGDTVGSADFTKIGEAFDIGEAATRSQAEKLAALSLSEEAFAAYRERIDRCRNVPAKIQWVRIENNTRFSDEAIAANVDIPLGEPLNNEQLQEDLQDIQAMGFIRLVTHEVIEHDGEAGIIVRVDEDPRGNTLIESGLDFVLGSEGSEINLRVGLLKTDLDELGSEVRVLAQVGEDPALYAEYWKPLSLDRRWFILPSASISRRNSLLFDSAGNRLLEFDIDEWVAEFRVGREFGRHAAVGAGIRRYGGDLSVRIGNPGIEDLPFDGGEVFVVGRYDRLDDRFIPREGSFVSTEFLVSDTSLGADADFEQFYLNAATAYTWGKHSVLGGLRYDLSFDDDLPDYALITAGGFLNFSGFSPNELIGRNVGLVVGGYRYELGRTGLLPAYVGASLEYGSVSGDRNDVFDDGIINGSIYIAYDSPIGPLYLGYGRAEGRSGVLFLRIGNIVGRQRLGR